MTDKNVKTAEGYYQAMGRKSVADVEGHIHPEVEFIAPLARMKGKEAFLEAARKFVTLFNTLKIHATFGEGDKAVVVYDLDCPSPVGSLRAVALMSFKDELISCIELFYDPRPFVK